MLIEFLPSLINVMQVYTESSDSNDGIFYILALGPAAAIIFYVTVYQRYRNTDKRHEYERETSSEVEGVQGYDLKTQHFRGLRHSRMYGSNGNTPVRPLGPRSSIEEE